VPIDASMARIDPRRTTNPTVMRDRDGMGILALPIIHAPGLPRHLRTLI